MSSEQRKHPRVSPDPKEPIQVHLMGTSLLEVVRANDVSLGGIGIRLPYRLPEWELQKKVEILVELPGDLKDFLVRGVIRQIGKENERGESVYGVQFLEIGPKGKQDLLVYINRILKKQRTSPGL